MVNTRAALNAQKGWVPFLVLAFALAMIADPAERAYDQKLKPRPFMTASVELRPNPFGKPTVWYAANAPSHVDGLWSAWVSVGGARGCDGGGSAGYGPPLKDPKPWEWAEWLGEDCPVPVVPFRVCARYSVKTGTGIGDIAGPFCSNEFTPRGFSRK